MATDDRLREAFANMARSERVVRPFETVFPVDRSTRSCLLFLFGLIEELERGVAALRAQSLEGAVVKMRGETFIAKPKEQGDEHA